MGFMLEISLWIGWFLKMETSHLQSSLRGDVFVMPDAFPRVRGV